MNSHNPLLENPVQNGSGDGPFLSLPAPFFVTRNLSVYYRGQQALGNVSLAVFQGAITSLIGPSGCGKSSFLMCLNRLTDLIPGCRVTGEVRADSRNLFDRDLDVVSWRRRVGMIFQKPNPFPLSIWRNVELPLRETGLKNRAEVDHRCEAALKDVGLWNEVCDRLSAPALSLSGGQQQRLCIARALVLEPEAVLMDEPCSALDPLSSGVVEDLIKKLRGRYTVVIVTHNLAQARRISDHVALFWVNEGTGRLIENGTAQQVFDSPRQELTAAYVNGFRG